MSSVRVQDFNRESCRKLGSDEGNMGRVVNHLGLGIVVA